MGKFTAVSIKSIKKIGMHADGDGLYLKVQLSTDPKQPNKSWIFRWGAGGTKSMGLGSLRDFSLAEARELALALGVASAQGAADPPPVKLDAAILFAPVGDLVPPALEALDRGGTLAVAGIHLSDIPALNYQRHLFQERQIRSVTSNTRADAREFLTFAGRHRIEVTTPEYPMSQADRALTDLADGSIAGAAVLLP